LEILIKMTLFSYLANHEGVMLGIAILMLLLGVGVAIYLDRRNERKLDRQRTVNPRTKVIETNYEELNEIIKNE